MLKLLKAEIENDKFKVLVILGFCLICFIVIWFGVKWERNRAPMAMLIMLVGTLAMAFTSELFRFEQKKDRLFVLLPVLLNRIRLFHLVYPFLIWLIILAIFFLERFFLQLFFSREFTMPSILQLLTLNGLILFVNTVCVLQRDLKMMFSKKWQRTIPHLLWIVIYVASLLPFYIVTNFFGVFGENTALQIFLLKLSQSPLWINIFGIGFSLFSWKTFARRRSYQ